MPVCTYGFEFLLSIYSSGQEMKCGESRLFYDISEVYIVLNPHTHSVL